MYSALRVKFMLFVYMDPQGQALLNAHEAPEDAKRLIIQKEPLDSFKGAGSM